MFTIPYLLSLFCAAQQSAPFVERDNATGKLKGYYVDLLDVLAQIGNFNYTLLALEVSNMTQSWSKNTPNWLINEMYRYVSQPSRVLTVRLEAKQILDRANSFLHRTPTLELRPT